MSMGICVHRKMQLSTKMVMFDQGIFFTLVTVDTFGWQNVYFFPMKSLALQLFIIFNSEERMACPMYFSFVS
jgi:hypothetical protein